LRQASGCLVASPSCAAYLPRVEARRLHGVAMTNPPPPSLPDPGAG
jgi:hypothetical protein